MINEDHLGLFTIEHAFTHIKFIKLELHQGKYIRETFEMSFSVPRNTLLIEFEDYSNHIMIIILEHNRIPSNLVIQNIIKFKGVQGQGVQEQKRQGVQEQGVQEQGVQEQGVQEQGQGQGVQEQQFNDKFSETVLNFFKGGGQIKKTPIKTEIKNENNEKINNSTFSWNIRKR